jgi:hypothetical protein
MKLYHGSSGAIEQPSIAFSRSNLDFGKGFYLTSYPEQAERWAKRKALRAARQAVVSVYEMSEDLSGFLKRNGIWTEHWLP